LISTLFQRNRGRETSPKGGLVMIWKVRFAHSGKSESNKRDAIIRTGKEIYRHPKGYFVVLEFQGKLGKFRESFRPYELKKVV
jgi:hypothetical protein